jgi:hypothetical protein
VDCEGEWVDEAWEGWALDTVIVAAYRSIRHIKRALGAWQDLDGKVITGTWSQRR